MHRGSLSHVRLTWITVAIVIISITCDVVVMATHVLWSLIACFQSLTWLEGYRRDMANISNVFATFNSSVHFVVYCAFSRQFRHVLCRMLRCETVKATEARSSQNTYIRTEQQFSIDVSSSRDIRQSTASLR